MFLTATGGDEGRREDAKDKGKGKATDPDIHGTHNFEVQMSQGDGGQDCDDDDDCHILGNNFVYCNYIFNGYRLIYWVTAALNVNIKS